jgi:hypothetical protein
MTWIYFLVFMLKFAIFKNYILSKIFILVNLPCFHPIYVVLVYAICFSYSLIQNKKSNIHNFVKLKKTQTFRHAQLHKNTSISWLIYTKTNKPNIHNSTQHYKHTKTQQSQYILVNDKPTNTSWSSPCPILYKNWKTQLMK